MSSALTTLFTALHGAVLWCRRIINVVYVSVIYYHIKCTQITPYNIYKYYYNS